MVIRQYKLNNFGETKRLLSVNEVLCDQLSFKEKLYVYDEAGRRVGRFSVNISSKESQNSKEIMVHISNKAVLQGKTSESTVTGCLMCNMKTLEEIRYENWIHSHLKITSQAVRLTTEMEGGKHERRFYLLRERTKYYYSVTESVGEVSIKRRKTIPFTKSAGILGEAANIVLMRAIAIRGFEGILCLKTILSNGKECQNYYVSKTTSTVINGVKVDAIIIYRCITDHKKYNLTVTGTFTKAGQLLQLFWSNTGYFLHVDPDLKIDDKIVDENQVVGLHRHWNRDKQVFSYYLDKKLEQEYEIRTYRLSNQVLKRVTADWLQFVLFTKPNDIIASAIEYFSSFNNSGSKHYIKPKADNERGTVKCSGPI